MRTEGHSYCRPVRVLKDLLVSSTPNKLSQTHEPHFKCQKMRRHSDAYFEEKKRPSQEKEKFCRFLLAHRS